MSEREIFLAVLDLPDPSAWAVYLDGACGCDPALRARVEALLRSHEAAGSFLGTPAFGPPDPETAPTRAYRPPGSEPGDGPTWTHGEGADDDRADALAFLAPPGRPGSLGRIGHYEVLEVLGRGGFGIVFRAFDEILQRVVAVKVMAPSLAVTSPARKRFIREGQSSAKVRHENVVQVHSVEEQPLPYLVMEFVPGETLQQRLDRIGPLEVAEVLRIGRQIAEGLAAAHATGLIHRDIKPSNILIDDGPHRLVKITDFGLARAADDASLTRSGVVAGTPMYMAPEQAKGESLDHRADLFSLGSVLYVMTTGRPPFRATTTLAVLKRVAEDEPRPIREIIPEVPEWLCRIVEKLHAKDPEQRFQSVREVADVLADCETQLKAHSELRDFTLIPEGEPKPAPPSIERWKWVVAAALACLLLIPIGIVLFKESVRHSSNAPVQKPKYAVLELRLNDTAIRYWVDRHGAMQTGVAVVQLPLEPGEHTVWFSLGDRQFETVAFHLAVGETTELSLEVTPARGQAFLNGKPLGVTTLGSQSPDGWVQLFNGKDLTGWEGLTDLWRIEGDDVTGSTKEPQGVAFNTFLVSKKPYKDFELRFQARIKGEQGNTGLQFRSKLVDGKRFVVNGPQVDLGRGVWSYLYLEGTPGRFLAQAPADVVARTIKPLGFNEFYVRCVGKHLTVKFNGDTTIDGEFPEIPDDGVLALQMHPGSPIEATFRKIEIKELSPPKLPDTAEQVLPALAGAWKGEYTQKVYGGKPAEKKITAVAVNDWIVGQKWLRQRVQMESEGFQSITCYEPNSKTFRDWFFHSRGLIFGPSTGRWDSATRTMTWTNLPEDGVILLMILRFLDADTFTGEILIRDKEGKTVFEMASRMTRTTENLTIDEGTYAGPLPPEMAVLDRLVGDWQYTGVIKDAESPDGLKATWQSASRKILGGRVIAAESTGHPRFKESYSLSTFDSIGKAYGRWLFKADGTVLEYDGGWNEKTQTMKWHWADKDGSQSTALWHLRDADRYDFQLLTKDALGKTTADVQATSVRQREPGWVAKSPTPPDPAVVQALRDAVMAKERSRDAVRLLVDAGRDGKGKLIAAEVELLESRIQLAQVEGQKVAVVGFLKAFVSQRQEERALIQRRVQAGADAADVLNQADARLAEAKARLAKAKSESPEVAPEPVEPGWVQLFNGKDLTGWKPHPLEPGTWQVEDQILLGSNGPGRLYSQGNNYHNFHLRMEVAITAGGSANVCVRADTPRPGLLGDPSGYAVEFGNEQAGGFSFFDLVSRKTVSRESQDTIKPDAWFMLEFIADGNRLITKVNGVSAVAFKDRYGFFEWGHIALQNLNRRTVTRFRRIEIKELPVAGESQALDGIWKVSASETNGNAASRDVGDILEISGINCTMLHQGKEISRGTLRLDLNKSPRTIDANLSDLEGKVVTSLGIYDIDGEQCRICWALPDSPMRPTEFTSREANLLTLRRILPGVSAPPVPGTCLSGSGRDSRIEIPGLKYDGSHPITLEAWVRQPTRWNSISTVISSDCLGIGSSWTPGLRTGSTWTPTHWHLAVKNKSESSADGVALSRRDTLIDPYGIGRWTHVTLVCKEKLVLYLDGQLQTATLPIRNGQQRIDPKQVFDLKFNGLIRGARISKGARYEKDFTPEKRLTPDKDTLALYHFEEGTGDVVQDASGNGYDGKIVDAKWFGVVEPKPKESQPAVAPAPRPKP